MTVKQLREKAKTMGINPGRMKKSELVRTIQQTEGNFPCFATAGDFCDQNGCSWRQMCMEPAA